MKILDDKVLIKTIAESDRTNGGIFLPQSRLHEPTEHGVVMSVGPGKLKGDGSRAEMQLQEGDQVIMHYRHVGCEIKINDDKFRIMIETDVLAKVEDEEV